MNTPKIKFLGWDKPAIELVAEKLLTHLNDKKDAAQYRRATVVVPTSESGRRLREYMAEKAKNKAILLPRIILAGQLIPAQGENILTETEMLTVWLQLLISINNDTLKQYAPLIPYRPETHIEKWAIGVAHKLIALRSRLEQEEITYDSVTGHLARMKSGIDSTLASLPEKEECESRRRTLTAQRTVLQDEQKRWQTLGRVFMEADTLAKKLYPKKIQPKDARKAQLKKAEWPGQCRLIILACVPELSSQLQHYLGNLHGRNGGEVQVWIHAPETEEKTNFDAFGRPVEENWATREIHIPDAFVYPGEDLENVDNSASTIHLVNDAEAMAEEALRLAGGSTSQETVLAVGDAEFSPALLNAFAAAGWKLNMPEGRSPLSADLGRLASQLADACDARENLPLWKNEPEAVTNNGTQGLDAFAALLCNTALQQAWADDAEALTGLQEHVENIRMLLLPGSEAALLHMLEQIPAVDNGYKSIEKLQKHHNNAYHAYADKVSKLITTLSGEQQSAGLKQLAKALEKAYTKGNGKLLAKAVAKQMQECAKQGDKLPSRLFTMELLRHRVENKVNGPALVERISSVGDILGWRELAYTREKQVILAAMHDGCIPEPVPEDDFLPETLCQELGIRHEKFRIARDSYLLTALINSRRKDGRVDFILARQKEDGSVLAPSSLLMRCGDELPRRARTLFAESKTPKTLPTAAPCPLRRTTGSKEPVTPGKLESIDLIAAGRQNPYTRPIKDENGNTRLKTFSPSSLATFLQCPLTFWIKNLLNIDLGNSYKENKGELESNEYGTVMHAVLDKLVAHFRSEEALLQECPAAETDTEAGINHMQQKGKEFAEAEWQHIYNSTTTRDRQPLPMEVQLQAIERSLLAFVTQHLQDLRDGWYNVVREYTLEPEIEYAEGQFAQFSMNADRIDRNKDGRWRIIDYKTSSSEKRPHKVHFDELDNGEGSMYCRFMNVQGYEFGTVYFGEKLYRWSDVQLPLYAYGLRHPSPADREELGIPAAADMSAIVPELVYYNLQSKTEKLVPFYLVRDGQVEPISSKVPDVPETEEMLESAMQTVKSAIGMIRKGLCLFSAESLELKTKPYSVLVTPGSNTPRFGALSLQSDPRSLFELPSLTR